MFNPVNLNEFEQRTGIQRSEFLAHWTEADRFVSLRDLNQVLSIQAMPKPYLCRLLESVTLRGDPTAHPFAGCKIQTMRIDPSSLMVGQTFVERANYGSLIENFRSLFDGFCLTKGFAKLTAQIVLGRTADGSIALAHYLPPIIEQHDTRLLLMDGMHRNFIVLSAGTTIEAIKIHDARHPFPCSPQRWDAVRPVDVKPPKNERFFDLQPELFRDLKSVGIDG
ncbi:hypothetical protein KKF05_04660 [Patescibacteria group bacterium]|nr:hypothetical protein [Patescibacteria group bacterium]MBU1029092.1 hypothetical protein [Patescibacteria group bacterium]MBU1915683.1 hypothetical protein [Patescibacteria group bacterium]